MAKAVGISDLLAAAFSSSLNSTVVTYDQYKDEESKTNKRDSHFKKLDVDQLFTLGHVAGRLGTREEPAGPYDDIQLFVNTANGKHVTVTIGKHSLVEDVKMKLQDREGIPPDEQRLIFCGKPLEDHRELSYYGINEDSTLFMLLRLPGGGAPTYYIDDSLRDPTYDYDFTNITDDGTKFKRGEYKYERPYGWERYALKVLDKYGDNKWLGKAGYRAGACEGEWPVSYHGTGEKASGNIAQKGYDLSKGRRFKYGKGIYSTPSIDVAAAYAQVFMHKGKRYKIVFQNRISPTEMQIVDDATTGGGDYWVQPFPDCIRPYGLCIQRA